MKDLHGKGKKRDAGRSIGFGVDVGAVTGATERHLVALVGTTRRLKGAGGSAPRISLSTFLSKREMERTKEELHTVNIGLTGNRHHQVRHNAH